MKVYSIFNQRADTKNMEGEKALEEKRLIYQRHSFGEEELTVICYLLYDLILYNGDKLLHYTLQYFYLRL